MSTSDTGTIEKVFVFPKFIISKYDSDKVSKILKFFLEEIHKSSLGSKVFIKFLPDRFHLIDKKVEVEYSRILFVERLQQGQIVILQLECSNPDQVSFEAFGFDSGFRGNQVYWLLEQSLESVQKRKDKITAIALQNVYQYGRRRYRKIQKKINKTPKTYCVTHAFEYHKNEPFTGDNLKYFYDTLNSQDFTLPEQQGLIWLSGKYIHYQFRETKIIPIKQISLYFIQKTNNIVYFLIRRGVDHYQWSLEVIKFIDKEEMKKFFLRFTKRYKVLTSEIVPRTPNNYDSMRLNMLSRCLSFPPEYTQEDEFTYDDLPPEYEP